LFLLLFIYFFNNNLSHKPRRLTHKETLNINGWREESLNVAKMAGRAIKIQDRILASPRDLLRQSIIEHHQPIVAAQSKRIKAASIQ
jgi:hypothetical protein